MQLESSSNKVGARMRSKHLEGDKQFHKPKNSHAPLVTLDYYTENAILAVVPIACKCRFIASCQLPPQITYFQMRPAITGNTFHS